MTAHSPQAVLFDLDGTLIDTAPDFVVAVNQLLQEHQRSPVDAERIRQQVSAGARAVVCLAFDIDSDHPTTDALRERFLTLYDEHLSSQASLFEGLDQLLDRLDQQGIPWGIVTNKPFNLAEKLIQRLQLHKRCQTLICPEHVAERKPAPESLFLACREIDVAPEQCIYVGDHQRDIAAGLNAGMETIAALYGYIPSGEAVDEWGAHHTVKHSRDLEALLFPR